MPLLLLFMLSVYRSIVPLYRNGPYERRINTNYAGHCAGIATTRLYPGRGGLRTSENQKNPTDERTKCTVQPSPIDVRLSATNLHIFAIKRIRSSFGKRLVSLFEPHTHTHTHSIRPLVAFDDLRVFTLRSRIFGP